jgi:N utilization substance protein B
MQVLFLWDSMGTNDAIEAAQLVNDGTNEDSLRHEALAMAAGAWSGRGLSDAWVQRLAPQWPLHRQPSVDRNLIRLAVWELTATDTPPKVIIDEAIELAKDFSTEHSPAFINGVLDAVLKERTALIEGKAP